MAEAANADTQSANSPARQLLAALHRTSQEMEKSVNETYEYVQRVNSELERVINGQLDESSEQVELYIRSHMDGISAEKDSIIAQLTELRQEELKILQGVGKGLRLTLVEKLDELVAAFRTSIDVHLKEFQDVLKENEESSCAQIETRLSALKAELPVNLEALKKTFGEEKASLEKSEQDYAARLEKESGASLNELQEHSADLKNRLAQEAEEYISSLEKNGAVVLAAQKELSEERVRLLKALEDSASIELNERTAADTSYVRELPDRFSESCKQMAQVQVGMHSTVTKNLVLQYRTEILSAAQMSEDELQIVKADLQSTLRQYQSHYAEQFESLLSRFERTALELAESQIKHCDSTVNTEEILGLVNSKFNDMKKTMQENVKESVSETELSMEKSCEDFRVRLDNLRKASCDNVEAIFKNNQDELSKLQQANEEQLQEFSKVLDSLEQSVSEAKDLIKALDQAILDF